MDWGDYRPHDPGVDRPLHELPGKEARAAYERMMAAKDARIEALKRLLRANGVELDGSDESLQALQDWLRSDLEPDSNDPGAPRAIWFGVIHDIGMYMGDLDHRSGAQLGLAVLRPREEGRCRTSILC